MKIDTLIAVDAGCTDEDLTFLGGFVPERLASIASEITGGAVYYALPPDYRGRLAADPGALVREDREDGAFWRALFGKSDAEHIIRLHADAAFLDPDAIREMIELQTSYCAEFTYSENLPAGFSCEIVSRALVETLPETEQKTLPLAEVVRANINQFDVELHYREPDIRDTRISFRASNRRDRRIMENLFRIDNRIPAYGEVRGRIEKNPGALYVGPSYVELELTGRCPLACIFCYRKTLPAERPDMDMGTLQAVLAGMRGFDLPYAVCLGGSGEPLEHARAFEAMDLVLAEPLVSALVIETNGVRADENFTAYLAAKADSRVKVIVNCNGLDAETYRTAHGADEFARVHRNVIAMRDAVAGVPALSGLVHLQVMKINETEPFLDRYYDFWEKTGIPIILQKQNTYLGALVDRRYADLTPLERTPCWHLQRDLVVFADGTVAFCKQDIAGANARGSLAASSLAELWEAGRQSFLDEYAKRYPRQPDCRVCDEWYTFNL